VIGFLNENRETEVLAAMNRLETARPDEVMLIISAWEIFGASSSKQPISFSLFAAMNVNIEFHRSTHNIMAKTPLT
jgi:hypothetical protein